MTNRITNLEMLSNELRGMSRGNLLIIAERAIELLPRVTLKALVGDYVHVDGVVDASATPKALLDEVQKFQVDSLAGRYFEDFEVNSRNCTATRSPGRTGSSVARRAVLAHPARKHRLVDLTSRNGEHGQRGIGLARHQAPAVERQKQANRQKSDAFVAVEEGVVSRQADAAGRSQVSHIRLAIERKIQWPRERGVEQTFITQPTGTTMLGQALVVQQFERAPVEPAPAHLASW